MPDERDRHAGLLVERHLEGKDHQHAIDEPSDALDPRAPPRPELRADVVHDRHAELVNGPRQNQIEVRKINRNEDVRSLDLRRPNELPIETPRSRKDTKRLGEARHGQPAEVADELRARSPEPLSSEADDPDVRLEPPQLGCQRRGVQIPGGFAARDHHPQAL